MINKTEVEADLSLHEEIETSLECQRLAFGIEESSYDARRLLDQQEGLINLSETTSVMRSASLEELALIEIAAELVCAATDLNAEEDLVPGLESFEGKTPSLEFLSKVSDFAFAILEKIRELLDRMISFIRSGISRNNQLRLKLQIQLKMLRRSNLSEPIVEAPIAIKDANALAVDYTYPEFKSAQETKVYFATHLAKLKDVSNVVYGGLVDKVLGASKKMSDELKAVAGDRDPETSLAASNFAVADVLKPVLKITQSRQERSGVTAMTTGHLLGNVTVGIMPRDKASSTFALRLATGHSPATDSDEVIKEAKYLSDLTIRIMDSTNDEKFANSAIHEDVAFKFFPLNKTDLVEMLEIMDGFLKDIYDFEKNKLSALQRESDALRRDAEALKELLGENKRGKRVTTDGSIPLSDARYARAIMSHKETLYRWSSFPFTGMTRHIHKTIGALMRVTTRNTMFLDDEQPAAQQTP